VEEVVALDMTDTECIRCL